MIIFIQNTFLKDSANHDLKFNTISDWLVINKLKSNFENECFTIIKKKFLNTLNINTKKKKRKTNKIKYVNSYIILGFIIDNSLVH